MKKYLLIAALVFISSFAGSQSVSASVCGPIYNDDVPPVQIGFAHCESPNPALVNQAWGLTGAQTKSVRPGETFKDEQGVESTCAWWMSSGCYDFTNTNYYRAKMIALANELILNGRASYFPIFRGWINSVR